MGWLEGGKASLKLTNVLWVRRDRHRLRQGPRARCPRARAPACTATSGSTRRTGRGSRSEPPAPSSSSARGPLRQRLDSGGAAPRARRVGPGARAPGAAGPRRLLRGGRLDRPRRRARRASGRARLRARGRPRPPRAARRRGGRGRGRGARARRPARAPVRDDPGRPRGAPQGSSERRPADAPGGGPPRPLRRPRGPGRPARGRPHRHRPHPRRPGRDRAPSALPGCGARCPRRHPRALPGRADRPAAPRCRKDRCRSPTPAAAGSRGARTPRT